jgi:anti-anti-sigma factor
MEKGNEIRLEKHGEVTLLDVQGDVTTFSEPFLKKAYEDANDQGAGKILLKFDKKAYINSGGIAVLIQLLAEAKGRDQQISITGLSEHFTKIFNMVGITKFARIFDTIEEALKSMSEST